MAAETKTKSSFDWAGLLSLGLILFGFSVEWYVNLALQAKVPWPQLNQGFLRQSFNIGATSPYLGDILTHAIFIAISLLLFYVVGRGLVIIFRRAPFDQRKWFALASILLGTLPALFAALYLYVIVGVVLGYVRL